MSRKPSRRRALRALALPFLCSLGFSVASCSSDDGDKGDGSAQCVSKLIYIVRQHTTVDANGAVSINVAGGMGQVMDYLRYEPGGKLEILDLATGSTQNLISAFPEADVSSLDLTHDG